MNIYRVTILGEMNGETFKVLTSYQVTANAEEAVELVKKKQLRWIEYSSITVEYVRKELEIGEHIETNTKIELCGGTVVGFYPAMTETLVCVKLDKPALWACSTESNEGVAAFWFKELTL